jgi:hypothetical protein
MIPDTLLQALSLDLSVLEALLKKNYRCSHGRAKYFSRISMTLRSIQRYNFSDIPSQLTTLEKEVNTQSQQLKRKKRRNEEEAWDLKKKTKDPVLVSLEQQLSNLQQTLCDHLPQVLSRIQHASVALFKEVSRGFFLPFCTVALAALARTRMLLRRLGRLALVDLNQFKGTISEVLGEQSSILLTSDQMEQGIYMYMAPSSGPPDFTIQNDAIRAQTLASLGLTNVQFIKSETQSNQGNKAETTSNIDLSAASSDEFASNLGSTAAPMEYDDDGDDLGESMEDNRTELEADDIEQVGPAADDSQSNLRRPSDPMDRNMALVVNIKAKAKKQDKKTPKDKKSKKDSKKRKDPERAQPPAGVEKKSKTKKKGKGDFFDSLFD